MLAHLLALAIGLGSFALYMAAFFFPEVHRKQDFFFSGFGLFYALVLWVCAERIAGGVLLGQMASGVLLGWFGWQTLKLRRELTPVAERTPVSESQLQVLTSPQQLADAIASVFRQPPPPSGGGLSGQAIADLDAEPENASSAEEPADTPTASAETDDKD